jgi:hypothetical protein
MFARKIQDITGKKNFVFFSLDGDYRIDFESGKFFDCFQTEWASQDISPEGTLTFHVGENYGDPPVVIDLADPESNPTQVKTPLSYVDVEVSGLPEGGVVFLYAGGMR